MSLAVDAAMESIEAMDLSDENKAELAERIAKGLEPEDRFWRPSEESRKSFYPNDPEPSLPVKNERGMYVVEEVIHHGDYRSVRRVEVYELNKRTIDGILMSSAYGYGGVAEKYRERMLLDLQEGHVNRTIGWSTFRVL
jgi:hypothetical protein